MDSKDTGHALTYEILKPKQREIRHTFPESLALRAHRALSWLKRAEQETDDFDAAFIFYWIAFNSAYAQEEVGGTRLKERSAFDEYFKELIGCDLCDEIYNAIWTKFHASIRILLDNRYVFQPFWNYHNDLPGYEDWDVRFDRSKNIVRAALGAKNTHLILTTVFDRLYVLRNQIIHGGATWNSSVNRSQVRDGANILAFLVPLFIDLMMDNPGISWGTPNYPVIE